MSREWYSVNEVAEILGESYKKIYNLVVSGELGHYRVGRSYRIRKADLDAYFAQQAKELRPTLVQTVDVPEAVVLDKVAVPQMRTYQSAAEQMSAPAAATPSRETQAVSLPRWSANEPAVRDNVAMGSIGEQKNLGRILRRREVDYIENFQHLFHQGLAVVHPITDEIIKFADWSVVEQLEDELLQLGHYLNVAILRPEQQASYPSNVRVLYWVEPNSLGGILRKYPKEGLVIECATLSRLERLVTAGSGEERMGVSTVEQLVQERHALIQRWSLRYAAPVAYLVGLASTTGWDQESIAYVRDYADNTRLFPYLVDLVDLQVYSSDTHQKGMQYRELFELPLGDKKVKQIQNQIKTLLLSTGAIHVTDLQAQIDCSQGLLREACLQLAKSNPEYSILQDGSHWIIRTG